MKNRPNASLAKCSTPEALQPILEALFGTIDEVRIAQSGEILAALDELRKGIAGTFEAHIEFIEDLPERTDDHLATEVIDELRTKAMDLVECFENKAATAILILCGRLVQSLSGLGTSSVIRQYVIEQFKEHVEAKILEIRTGTQVVLEASGTNEGAEAESGGKRNKDRRRKDDENGNEVFLDSEIADFLRRNSYPQADKITTFAQTLVDLELGNIEEITARIKLAIERNSKEARWVEQIQAAIKSSERILEDDEFMGSLNEVQVGYIIFLLEVIEFYERGREAALELEGRIKMPQVNFLETDTRGLLGAYIFLLKHAPEKANALEAVIQALITRWKPNQGIDVHDFRVLSMTTIALQAQK